MEKNVNKVITAKTAVPAKTDQVELNLETLVKEEKVETKPVVETQKKEAEKKETVNKAAEKKTTVNKTAAKKTTAKKASAKETERIEEVYVQFSGQELLTKEVLERAKQAYISEGHKESSIKSIRLYIKPEEHMAYYVINEKIAGGVPV